MKMIKSEIQHILVEKHGISVDEASSITQTFLKNFRKCPENTDMSLHEWRLLLWTKALGEIHSQIADAIYAQWLHLRYKYLSPPEEVISLLESLKKYYYIGLISNGNSNSQWEKITRLQLVQYFDYILVSGDVPWEKPNKQIFLKACSHLGVRPENCVMVGDKLETDILGAAQAGLGVSIWIPLNEPGLGHSNGDIKPDFTIKNVMELKNLLSPNFKKSSIFCPDFEDCNSNSSDGS